MKKFAVHISLILSVLIAPTLLKAAPDYSVLDTTRNGRQLYRDGAADCSASKLVQAAEALSGCYDTLMADEDLRRAFEPFAGKTAWLTAWSYFRRYEIDPRSELLDSASLWFGRVVRTEDSLLAPGAAYMRGECGWRWIEAEVWQGLCESPGLLPEEDLQKLLDHAEVTAGRFDSSLNLAVDDPLLDDAAQLRQIDLSYLTAWLQRAAHRDSVAVMRVDSVTIRSLEETAETRLAESAELRPVADYTRAWCDLALDLWPIERPPERLDLRDWASMPGPYRALRQGLAAQLAGDYLGAAGAYGRAAEAGIAEGHYWRGTAYLIAATSQQALDRARLTTLDALRRSRQSYQAFLDIELEQPDYRLSQLVAQSRRKLLLLRVATGKDVDFDRMHALGKEDLRFLVRIIVNTLEPQRSRALNNLADYLRALLENPGIMQDSERPQTECLVGSPEPLTADETRFYLGLTQALYAQGTFGDRRARAFLEAASTLAEVGGQYRTEAVYMRARALFSGREYDEAEPLFRRLVAEHRSTRAAYWYVANFARSQDLSAADSQHVRQVLQAVIATVEEADIPTEYTSTHRNAEAQLGRFEEGRGVDPSRVLTGLDNLVCPESLSVDSVGPWPQRVFYETLYERDLIERQFARLGREELSVFGPQPRILFPATRTCGEEAEYFIIDPAPVADSIELDDKWTARVQLASKSAGGLIGAVDSCHARNTTTGETMRCRWDARDQRYYLEPKATVYDVLELTVFHSGHYPRVFTMTSDQAGGFKDTVIALAERLVFSRAGERSLIDTVSSLTDKLRRNAILADSGRSVPLQLRQAIVETPPLRDVDYDRVGSRWLGASIESGSHLAVLQGENERMPLSLNEPLSSPEGLAVLPDGRIAIADWGNHRIVITDNEGRAIFSFGVLGRFSDSEVLGEGRLVFPTRIAVVHDNEGIEIDETRYPRPTHIVVADRYGIHRFDSQGRYLETPLAADSADYGAWYDLRIEGYGKGAGIEVVDLKKDRVLQFRAEP